MSDGSEKPGSELVQKNEQQAIGTLLLDSYAPGYQDETTSVQSIACPNTATSSNEITNAVSGDAYGPRTRQALAFIFMHQLATHC